jgi:hypothetical protein
MQKEGDAMVDVDATVRRVRKAIVDGFVATGRSPNPAEIAAELKISRQQVLAAFRELPKYDTFAVERGTENVRILSPFSNLATPFKVAVDGEQRWYAVCGPESLAITYMFPGRKVGIEAHCRDCGDPIRIEMQDGEVLEQDPPDLLIHLGVPVASWFEDLPFA